MVYFRIWKLQFIFLFGSTLSSTYRIYQSTIITAFGAVGPNHLQEQSQNAHSSFENDQRRLESSSSSSRPPQKGVINKFNTTDDTLRSSQSPLRIAIVVAGGLLRYTLDSTIHRMIAPMVAQGHQVDYFLSLETHTQRAFRFDLEYMNHIVPDPLLDGNRTNDELQQFIQQKIQSVGGQARQVVLDRELDVMSYPPLVERLKSVKAKNPEYDAFLQFPTLDIRKSVAVRKRTIGGNRNILKLFFNIQALWTDVVEAEKQDGQPYDWVFFLRDDTLWLMDLDINQILDRHDTSQLVSLSCDKRDPPMKLGEMNDHIIFTKRAQAAVYGNYIDQLIQHNLTRCHVQVPPNIASHGRRGCNSEMLLKWIMAENGVLPAVQVGQAVLPLQRSVHVKVDSVIDNVTVSTVTPCFHKVCNSHADPLPDHPLGLQSCKDIRF